MSDEANHTTDHTYLKPPFFFSRVLKIKERGTKEKKKQVCEVWTTS